MDWIAGIAELVGIYTIGCMKRGGFLFNIVGCLLWITVCIDKQIYGLLLVVIPSIIINSRNYIKWRKL